MKKIYLAKSNLSEHSILIEVRSILKKSFDEVIECEKVYSIVELKRADILVVLPASFVHSQAETAYRYVVGRGLYSTILDYGFNTKEKKNTYLVVKDPSGKLWLSPVVQIQISGVGDWKNNYAYIYVSDLLIDINNADKILNVPLKATFESSRDVQAASPVPTPKKRRLLS